MERHKRNIDASYENKSNTQQGCVKSIAPMTLSNQLLHIPPKFLIGPGDSSKQLRTSSDDNNHQCSSALTKNGILPSYTDTNNSGLSLSPTSCAEMNELFQCNTKQAAVEYPRHGRSRQGLVSDVGDTKTNCTYSKESPVFRLPSDIMAVILVFLEPSEVLEVVSSPLCKKWIQSYARDNDLWKVLCTLKPFKVDHGDYQELGNQGSLYSSIQAKGNLTFKVSRHRLLYISFVRCVNYLRSLKQGNRNATSMKPIDRNVGNELGLSSGAAPHGVLSRRRLGNEVPLRSKLRTKVKRNSEGSMVCCI